MIKDLLDIRLILTIFRQICKISPIAVSLSVSVCLRTHATCVCVCYNRSHKSYVSENQTFNGMMYIAFDTCNQMV